MKKKLTNKELLQLTIDEEACKIINWLWKHKDTYEFYNESGLRLPAKEILEIYKKEKL